MGELIVALHALFGQTSQIVKDARISLRASSCNGLPSRFPIYPIPLLPPFRFLVCYVGNLNKVREFARRHRRALA